MSSQASGAKSAECGDAESESTAGPSRRPGSSSATDRSDSAEDDAAPAAESAAESAPAPAGLTDTTVETAEPEAVSALPVEPSATTIIEATAPPTKPNSPANPAGMASVVEMLGVARRDTDSTAEVVPAATPSPVATSPAAELLAAASSVAKSLGANSNVAVNGVLPTATVTVADNALKAGETSLVIFTFSEAVYGFTNADVTVPNGMLSALSSMDGGITWTATFTPTVGVTDTTILISLNNAGVTDLAGNAGVGVTVSNNYSIDTQRPTATISVADTVLRDGQSTTVTFTFSEAVSGFNNSDITVTNGTLSTVSSIDGGITWTATFTPNTYVSDSTNTITLNSTGAGISDAVGNAYVGTTVSVNYSVKTVPGGIKGFVWHIYDFAVNQVIRPIGGFFHMLFFGPPPHLNHQLPVTPWSIES